MAAALNANNEGETVLRPAIRLPVHVLLAGVLVACAVAGAAAQPAPGDPAPPIVAARWLRGGTLPGFAPGRVYVLDFWSTWCPPCIDTLPFIASLGKRYAGSATVIAMDVWEPDRARLRRFIDSHADILAATVATDSIPDGKEANEGLTAAAWLGTSAGASIPKTFIVDGQGRIAWVGAPEDVERPLAEVILGTWEVQAPVDSLGQAAAGDDAGERQ